MLESREDGLKGSGFKIFLIGIGDLVILINVIESDKVSGDGLSILRTDNVRYIRRSLGFNLLAFEKVRSCLGGTLTERLTGLLLEIINEDGKDAIVKKRSDTSVIVKEQRTREPKRPKIDYIRLMEEQLGEPELKQWQIDIMEQDAARTGKLFGDCG